MNNNAYKAITYLFFIMIITFAFISCQDVVLTPCATVGSSARSYSDCKTHDNETAETICCFVQGTSNSSDETSCLDVDILFKDRIIEYTSEGVNGKLICKTDSVGESTFLHISLSLWLIIISFIL